MPGRAVTSLSIKNFRLALPDLRHNYQDNWTALYVVTGHLVSILRGHVEFRPGDHAHILWDIRTEIMIQEADNAGDILTSVTR